MEFEKQELRLEDTRNLLWEGDDVQHCTASRFLRPFVILNKYNLGLPA